ncbi:MAG: hypothetical protein EOO54_22130, partial [Haliea sp.]
MIDKLVDAREPDFEGWLGFNHKYLPGHILFIRLFGRNHLFDERESILFDGFDVGEKGFLIGRY